MNVLFDANVLIDVLKKGNCFGSAYASYDVCLMRGWKTCICATIVPDLEYLLGARKILPRSQVRAHMGTILELFRVIDVAELDCKDAQQSDMPDMEDAIIAFSAKRNDIDVIVTSNIKDYALSPVPAITPADFVAAYAPKGVSYSEVELPL